MKTHTLSAILAAAAIAACASPALAVDYTWNAAGTALWSTSGNWTSSSPGTVPDDTSDNIVGFTNTGTLLRADGNYTIGNITLSSLPGARIIEGFRRRQ